MKIKIIITLFIFSLFIFFSTSKLLSQKRINNQAYVDAPEFDVVELLDNDGNNVTGEFFSWGDFNNDGYPDLLIKGCGLYENYEGPDGNREFKDVTKKAKLVKGTCFGVWGDYDNDENIDILSLRGILWKNMGDGTFKNVIDTEDSDVDKVELRISNRANAISWLDYDKDSFIDIYIATQADAIDAYHELWRNKGKHFEKISINNNIGQSLTYGRSVGCCDYDNDGLQEIYVGNYGLKPNFLWNFHGAIGVDNIAISANCAGNRSRYGTYYGNTMGIAWADFDNNGNFDLCVANIAHKNNALRGYVCDDSNIYINQGQPHYEFVDCRALSDIPKKNFGGTIYVPSRGTSFINDEMWYDVTCADFNNDGYVDILVTQAYPHDRDNRVILAPHAITFLLYNLGNSKSGEPKFKEARNFGGISDKSKIELFGTVGAAAADFNCDGFVDIVTFGSKNVGEPGEVYLYKNMGTKGSKNSWIEFKLVGTRSNKSAIGAVVKIRTKYGTQVRQVEGSKGLQGQQNSMILHFGLARIQKVDEAEIMWPSGKKQKLRDLSVKKIYEIIEP